MTLSVIGTQKHKFITVNVCVNAAGMRLPPFIFYKGKHIYNTLTEGGPAAACYGVSESGWMEEVNYFKWFELQFFQTSSTFSKQVQLCCSLMDISLIKKARSLGIHLFCLPPNTTHARSTAIGCRGIQTSKTAPAYHLKTAQATDQGNKHHQGALPWS